MSSLSFRVMFQRMINPDLILENLTWNLICLRMNVRVKANPEPHLHRNWISLVSLIMTQSIGRPKGDGCNKSILSQSSCQNTVKYLLLVPILKFLQDIRSWRREGNETRKGRNSLIWLRAISEVLRTIFTYHRNLKGEQVGKALTKNQGNRDLGLIDRSQWKGLGKGLLQKNPHEGHYLQLTVMRIWTLIDLKKGLSQVVQTLNQCTWIQELGNRLSHWGLVLTKYLI